MDTYSSVKEFNPTNFDHLRDRQARSIDDGTNSYEEIKKDSQISKGILNKQNQNSDDFGTSSI